MSEQNISPKAEAKEAVKQYENTNEKQEISRDALETIGCTRDNKVANWTRDTLPVSCYLYSTDIGWVMTEKHSKQQGPKRTIWYITGVGDMEITHEPLDLDAAREVLENNEHWTADTDQALRAIEEEHASIEHWWQDGLDLGGLAVVGSSDRFYLSQPLRSPEYPTAPELDSLDEEIFREAVSAAHNLLYDRPIHYDSTLAIHYVVEVEFDASEINTDEIIN